MDNSDIAAIERFGEETYRPFYEALSYSDLQSHQRLAALRQRILNETIARRPEAKAEYFDFYVEILPRTWQAIQPYLDKVEWIEHAMGQTDDRKNQMDWSGFRFKLKDDPRVFAYRVGSNWCSEIEDVVDTARDLTVRDLTAGRLVYQFLESYIQPETEDDDSLDSLSGFLAAQDLPVAVALLCAGTRDDR